MNIVTLIGRLTKDPELKYTAGKGTATTTITLAVDKFNTATNQKEADFINVVVWGKQAESLAQYQRKGSLIGINGRIQVRNYEKDGKKVYVTEVVAKEIQFLGTKNKDHDIQPNFADMQEIDDGDIPF